MNLPDYTECLVDSSTFSQFQLYLPRFGIVDAFSQQFYRYEGLCLMNHSCIYGDQLQKGQAFDASQQCQTDIVV